MTFVVPNKEEVTRRYIKYVYLDVVQFSKRSAEAQSEIVQRLNEIIRQALNSLKVNSENHCILIPTGDGMCLSFISPDLPYDVHIQIALDILKLVDEYNKSIDNETRKFQVRVGINQNTDILITDINDRDNVAGAGINLAARIMDKADGGQILVSQAVFHELQPSELYMDKFKSFYATGKHNISFQVHQYIGKEHVGLNVDTPSTFITPEKQAKPESKLTPEIAYYLAYAVKNRAFISKTYKISQADGFVLEVLLYLLAHDTYQMSIVTDSKNPIISTWKFNEVTIEEQLKYYKEVDFSLIATLQSFITTLVNNNNYRNLFDISGMWDLFVNERGKQKLKEEYPDIWVEFELDKFA